jgi:hypothetical protein
MESTGVYWIPAWNILEGGALELMLVNPATVRALAGEEDGSDRCEKDCGVSAVRPAERQLRAAEGGPAAARTDPHAGTCARGPQSRHQPHRRLLETVNIKLSSVASNIVGKSGQAMLRAPAAGVRRPEAPADRALGRLRNKIPELIAAFEGKTDEHFEWMLRTLPDKLDALDAEAAALDL